MIEKLLTWLGTKFFGFIVCVGVVTFLSYTHSLGHDVVSGMEWFYGFYVCGNSFITASSHVRDILMGKSE